MGQTVKAKMVGGPYDGDIFEVNLALRYVVFSLPSDTYVSDYRPYAIAVRQIAVPLERWTDGKGSFWWQLNWSRGK